MALAEWIANLIPQPKTLGDSSRETLNPYCCDPNCRTVVDGFLPADDAFDLARVHNQNVHNGVVVADAIDDHSKQYSPNNRLVNPAEFVKRP